MVQGGLGFILNKDTKFFKEESEKGHIEVALRVIEGIGKKEEYERQAKWKDPVDYLVFCIGALKVGNRWQERVITYYPYTVGNELQSIINEYKQAQYKIDEVFEPTDNTDAISMFRRYW